MTRSFLLPSRLSTCPRSSSSASRCEPRFASRSWRNSWWKYRRSCHFPRCSGLWSRPWTFQFRRVVCAVFKVFPQDRLQRRLLSLWNAFLSGVWSRSLIFPVEAFKIFSQDRAHLHLLHLQLVFVVLQMGLVKVFFALFPMEKSAECRAGQCGPAPARQLMDPSGLCAAQGFHEEQLAKEKEEDEGDVSAACSAVPAAGADAVPPRHLGTVFRVQVAGASSKGTMEGCIPSGLLVWSWRLATVSPSSSGGLLPTA